jgi:hypothetical protein
MFATLLPPMAGTPKAWLEIFLCTACILSALLSWLRSLVEGGHWKMGKTMVLKRL